MAKKHNCGKCAGCKKGLKCTMTWMDERENSKKSKNVPEYMKGKYTETKDKPKDKAMLKKRGLTSKADEAAFEKADKAHAAKKKPTTMKQDAKIDAKIMNKLAKKKEAAHEKREGKAGEKREEKREKKAKKK